MRLQLGAERAALRIRRACNHHAGTRRPMILDRFPAAEEEVRARELCTRPRVAERVRTLSRPPPPPCPVIKTAFELVRQLVGAYRVLARAPLLRPPESG